MELRGPFIHSRGQEGVWHSLFEKEGDEQGEENGFEFWFSRGSGFEATRWPLTSDARSRPPTASRGAARFARALNYLTLDTYNAYDTIAAPQAASRRVQRPAVRARSRRGAVGRHTRPLRALLPPQSVRRHASEAPRSL